jgi:hypothetical protein
MFYALIPPLDLLVSRPVLSIPTTGALVLTLQHVFTSPRLRLFRPVSRPVCGFGVSGSASLCVA